MKRKPRGRQTDLCQLKHLHEIKTGDIEEKGPDKI